MAARNRYIFHSKISETQFREILWLFCADLTATQIAQVSGLNRNTVNRIIRGIRERIATACKESPFSGEVEVDESYFGAASHAWNKRAWSERKDHRFWNH